MFCHSSQWWIWKKSSIAVMQTGASLLTVSNFWRGSFTLCAGSWPTQWSSYRSLGMFCREPRPSQMSARPQWKNWLSNLGEDMPVLIHRDTWEASNGGNVHVAKMRSAAVPDSPCPHCAHVSNIQMLIHIHTWTSIVKHTHTQSSAP